MTLTKEQKELVRLYVMAEITKFCAENQTRFATEIEAKYGFKPEDTTEEDHDRDTTIGNSPAAEAREITAADVSYTAIAEPEVS